jgi:hypothetical protein
MGTLKNTLLTTICLITAGTLLASCGKTDAPTASTAPTDRTAATVTPETPAGNAPDTTKATSPVAMVSWQNQEIEKMKNISTLDDLSKINPGYLKDPKKDHPKFVELQKKQVLLSIALSGIQTPEYREIQKSISEIYEAKSLWTPEIIALDAELQETLKSMGSGT